MSEPVDVIIVLSMYVGVFECIETPLLICDEVFSLSKKIWLIQMFW